MDRDTLVKLAIGGLVVGALAVGLAWFSAPGDTAPNPEVDRDIAATREGGTSRAGAGGASEASASTDPATGGTRPAGVDGATGAAAGAAPRKALGMTGVRPAADAPRKDFGSPEAASAFVEAHVLDLFAVVAPNVDPKSIDKTCTADGRDCTFTGPWPGDDFFKDWIKAIGEGRTSHAAMEGVTFSSFQPEGEGPSRRFVLEAHSP